MNNTEDAVRLKHRPGGIDKEEGEPPAGISSPDFQFSFRAVSLSHFQIFVLILSLCSLFSYIFVTPSILLLLAGAVLVVSGVALSMRKASKENRGAGEIRASIGGIR